jgi:hypothetical protein
MGPARMRSTDRQIFPRPNGSSADNARLCSKCWALGATKVARRELTAYKMPNPDCVLEPRYGLGSSTRQGCEKEVTTRCTVAPTLRVSPVARHCASRLWCRQEEFAAVQEKTADAGTRWNEALLRQYEAAEAASY